MKSIRTRLLVTLICGLVIVLAIGGLTIHTVAGARLVAEYDKHLEAKARTLASLVTIEGRNLIFDIGDGVAQLLQSDRYAIATAAGEVLLDPNDSQFEHVVPAEGTVVVRDTVAPDGTAMRTAWFAFRPVVEREEDDEDVDGDEATLGPPLLEAPEVIIAIVSLDRRSVDGASSLLAGTIVLVGIGVACTAILLVMLVVRWALAPLDRLARAVGVAPTDADTAFEPGPHVSSELIPIYDEINRLLGRVRQTIERERGFAGAAAHELRTPIAELRAAAEVGLRWPDTEPPDHTLAEILATTEDMERLVESLLLVSRGRGHDDDATAPLAEAIDASLARLASEIASKRLDIRRDPIPDDAIQLPRDGAEIILRNLLENAVHYTPSEGTIRIAVTSHELVVENGPVDLTEGDLARLFDAFWRQDRARNDRGHVGLGLAVVQRVANAAGIEIAAKLAGSRLTMRVTPETNDARREKLASGATRDGQVMTNDQKQLPHALRTISKS